MTSIWKRAELADTMYTYDREYRAKRLEKRDKKYWVRYLKHLKIEFKDKVKMRARFSESFSEEKVAWLALIENSKEITANLVTEKAKPIAHELQFLLERWHDNLFNPFHKVLFYELLDELRRDIYYSKNDTIDVFVREKIYEIILTEEDLKIRIVLIEYASLLNSVVEMHGSNTKESRVKSIERLVSVLKDFYQLTFKEENLKPSSFWKDYALSVIERIEGAKL